jgi:hypothetical protein
MPSAAAPRSRPLHELRANSVIPLLVHGQGVVLFESTDNTTPCSFCLLNKEKTQGLGIEFIVNKVRVFIISSTEPKELIDEKNTVGLINKRGVYYWFSLDTHNKTLYAGVGEPRLETMVYEYVFEEDILSFLESLTIIQFNTPTLKPLKLLRDPITSNVPLNVKNTNELTMNDIALGNVLPKASLSPIAQKLYDCIVGKFFCLITLEFPNFSDAIKYSIENPNGWCYKRLAEKAKEFSKEPHPLETYLRITLGQNSGESPGIPYVMEIWPVGHYSPIHSHSEANAVIRVLHGKLQVELYPFLCDEKDTVLPFATANFTRDDVTWISPTLNQTHRLTNLSTNTEPCITIQCYMYNEDDDAHYDYFDYLGDNGVKRQYMPDSDMDFIAFKKLMKEEWLSYAYTP